MTSAVTASRRSWSARTRSTSPNNDGGFNAGSLNTTSLALLAQSGQLELANSRLYAIRPEGEPGGPTVGGPSPYLAGWPKRVGHIFAELLPVVGEGITGSPVIGPVNCTTGGSGPKVGTIAAAGPAYMFNPDGSSCYGQSPDPQGRQQDNAMQTDFAVGLGKFDTPSIPAVGHPAFGDFAGGTSFFVPAAGVIRALDLGVNEYQGGQDFVAAYDPATGQFRPGFPSPVNDLQFLAGPSVADLDGLPGEEVLGGTASLDLYAMNSAGASFDPAGWPKLTGDWTVANPGRRLIGNDRHRLERAQGRGRAHALRQRVRIRDRGARLLAGVVAAFPSRQRQLGRLPP